MRWWFLASVLLIAALLVVGIVLTKEAKAQAACTVNVAPGQDLDAIINADSGTTATTFCLGSGTYNIDNPAILKSGDKLLGVTGTTVTRGPAVYPNPPASKLVGVNGV